MRKRIHKQKLERLLRYEKDNEAVIKDYKFEPGDLVLVRNTVVKSSLNRKMKPGYCTIPTKCSADVTRDTAEHLRQVFEINKGV